MLNQLTIQGRLTAAPEKKETNGGVEYVTFCLAVSRDRKKSNGERPTDFFECVAWRGTAEFIDRYFSKGQMMTVTGSMQSDRWTDADGNSRKSWNVSVQEAYFCDGPKRDSFGDLGDLPVPFEEDEGLPY